MKIQHIIPILFLAAFCTVSAQTPHRVGTVRYPNGEPAAGVHVTFNPGRYFSEDDFNYHEAISDQNGHYDIIPPSRDYLDGPLNLTSCIMVRDFEKNLAAVKAIPPMTTSVDLILQPAITFSGSVKNINGAPINGAVISLEIDSARYGSGMLPPSKVDEQGQFSISALPQGVGYRSLSTAKGYGSIVMQIPAKDTETNHYLFPPIVLNTANRILAGKVIGPDEKPVPSIKVVLGGRGQPMGTNRFLEFLTTKTDPSGNFIFNEVCDGEAQITVNDWIGTFLAHTSLSSPLGPESMFQAGETNVIIKVIERNYVRSSP